MSTIVDVTWSLGPGWLGPGWLGPGWLGPTWLGPGWLGPGWLGPGWLGPGWLGPGWLGPTWLGRSVSLRATQRHPGAASWVLLELPPGWSIVRLSDRGSCQVREAEIER